MEDTTFDRLINIQAYSEEDLKLLATQLSEEEKELSKRRRLLHGEIDIVRAEIVRRLRDKHGAGKVIISDGDLGALTDILIGRGPREPEGEEKELTESVAEPQGTKEAEAEARSAEPAGKRIQERFRDLDARVPEERHLRYLVSQVRQGRRLDDIMQDSYMMSHISETKRMQLMQHPQVIKAIQEHTKQEFAGFEPKSAPKAEPSDSE